ncbi:hypothetical protein [Algivirga pacifica]|uniref:Right handed beta helix region n=1 Tax=Algivirga pacifica TaxID=1162670 RepID=A0ABP9DQC9_9BACT
MKVVEIPNKQSGQAYAAEEFNAIKNQVLNNVNGSIIVNNVRYTKLIYVVNGMNNDLVPENATYATFGYDFWSQYWYGTLRSNKQERFLFVFLPGEYKFSRKGQSVYSMVLLLRPRMDVYLCEGAILDARENVQSFFLMYNNSTYLPDDEHGETFHVHGNGEIYSAMNEDNIGAIHIMHKMHVHIHGAKVLGGGIGNHEHTASGFINKFTVENVEDYIGVIPSLWHDHTLVFRNVHFTTGFKSAFREFVRNTFYFENCVFTNPASLEAVRIKFGYEEEDWYADLSDLNASGYLRDTARDQILIDNTPEQIAIHESWSANLHSVSAVEFQFEGYYTVQSPYIIQMVNCTINQEFNGGFGIKILGNPNYKDLGMNYNDFHLIFDNVHIDVQPDQYSTALVLKGKTPQQIKDVTDWVIKSSNCSANGPEYRVTTANHYPFWNTVESHQPLFPQLHQETSYKVFALEGFGETSTADATGADFSTLKQMEVVPKAYFGVFLDALESRGVIDAVKKGELKGDLGL